MMNVVTFYRPGGPAINNEVELIGFWKDAWAKTGWNPVIMDESDSKKHPLYSRMIERVSEIPNQNDRFYVQSTFLRWLAFCGLPECAIADYDVLPVKPFDPDPGWKNINGDLKAGPGFVFVEAGWSARFVEAIFNYVPDQTDVFRGAPHCGDQEIMRRTPGLFERKLDLCRVFGTPGWRQVPLVHFTNSSCCYRAQTVAVILGRR